MGRVLVNGDGAEWIKAAPRYIDQTELYLDRFHRNKALQEGLGFAPKLLQRARDAIEAGNLRELKQTLAEAVLQAEEDKRAERVRALRQYLLAN